MNELKWDLKNQQFVLKLFNLEFYLIMLILLFNKLY